MVKQTVILATRSIAVLLLFILSAGPARANDTDQDGNTCCLCLTNECCFLIDGDSCNAEGELKNPDLLDRFFETVGINADEFCNTCEQCAKNQLSPEEDARYLDVCDLCVFEPLFESHQCSPLPPPIAADELVSGGSCQISPSSSRSAIAVWTVGVPILIVLWRRNKFKTADR